MNKFKTLSLETIADSFGTDTGDLPSDCKDLLEKMDRAYRVIEGEERNDLVVDVINRINIDKQVIGAPERTARWHEGWKENLDELRESNYDLAALMPKFIRKNQPVRFMGDYIVPNEVHFEHVYFNIFRTWLFQKYFAEYDSIYDIGCGSSYNLTKLCEMFPNKKVYGFDFVQSSVDIVNDLASHHNLNAQGGLFNIIEPDLSINLDKNSIVFTSGVIEQIASKFEKFIDFLLEKKPELVVHIEPTYEVYDQDILFDYLAAKFHKKRGYTRGYLPRLKDLEINNKIEIIKIKRLDFGSLFMEGYTCIIWKPL